MSKTISPGGTLDFFDAGVEDGLTQDLNPSGTRINKDTLIEWNPERGNRAPSQEEAINHFEDKTYGLHHEYAAVIKDGYVMAVAHGTVTSVGITAKMKQHLEGATLAHNHPQGKYGGYSGTFSLADVKALKLGMSELRANSAEGTYSMKVDKNSDVEGFERCIYAHRNQINNQLDRAHSRCKKKYENGDYNTRNQYYADSASQQLKVIHRFYERHAADYGINYSFNKDASASEKMSQRMDSSKRNIQPNKPRTGKGSRTTVHGTYTENGTGKKLVHYTSNGKQYVIDAKGNKQHGADVQPTLNNSKRTGTMSVDSFIKFKKKW